MSGGIVRVLAPIAVLAAIATGCSDDAATPLTQPSGPAATTTAAPTTTAPPGAGLPSTAVTVKAPAGQSATDRQVIAGYQRFWEALRTAYTTGDVTALRATTAEPATTRFVKVATDLRNQERTLQGPVRLAPLVAGRGPTVTLAECADLREFRTYDKTGKALFPKDKGLTTAEVQLVNRGGTWRVTQFDTRPSGCRR